MGNKSQKTIKNILKKFLEFFFFFSEKSELVWRTIFSLKRTL